MIPYKKLKQRIERDKEKKRHRQAALHEQYDNLERVFTTRHYIRALQRCNHGVSFKLSVQKYNTRAITKINSDLHAVLQCCVPPITSSRKVVIKERGHDREITPIVIDNRVPQHVLCDYSLAPMLERRLIYDNGASMADKGVSFTRERFNEHLEDAKAKWFDNFFAFVFDFKGFFNSILHAICKMELDKTYYDWRIVDVTMQVIESYQIRDARLAGDLERIKRLRNHEGRGICLGSQVSQIMALIVPNVIDHAFKDVLGMESYKRYMDDGVIFHNSKEKLKKLCVILKQLAESIGLELNIRKTQIIHIRKGVTFLKVRYIVRGAKTIKLIVRAGTVRMRRKLKKFVHLVEEGKMTLNDVFQSLQSWLSHSAIAKSFHARKRMLALYDKLFGGYRLTKKWRCAAA